MSVFIKLYVDKSVLAILKYRSFSFQLGNPIIYFCNKGETKIVVVSAVNIKESLLNAKLHFRL